MGKKKLISISMFVFLLLFFFLNGPTSPSALGTAEPQHEPSQFAHGGIRGSRPVVLQSPTFNVARNTLFFLSNCALQAVKG